MSTHYRTLKSNKERIDFILKSSKCVVFYGGTWCPKCGELKPLFNKIAQKYGDDINFAYCDITECDLNADKYQFVPRFDCYYKGKRAAKYITSNQKSITNAIWDFIKNDKYKH